jgi:hypothetical protein
MVSVADALPAPSFPLMTAVVLVATAVVPIPKDAFVAPLGTVTDVGIVAAALDELSETTAPFAPALEVKVTVPSDIEPPATDEGDTDSREIV